jgi:hypothetical protein
MINRLGNQTLLSRRINQAISNSPLLQKRDRYQDSRLMMTNAVAALPDWTPQRVAERQLLMAETAPTVWKIPHGGADPWEL